MKYQLITTLNKNPGDEFIRVGVENIIKKSDKDAEFILSDKEQIKTLKLVEADKYIWCGMPLIWEINNYFSDKINWWKFLVNEFSVLPNAEIWGAGSCLGLKYNVDKLKELTSQIKCRVTARDYLLSQISGWELDKCPAFYSIANQRDNRELKLCNWIPKGGHYIHANRREAAIWRKYKLSIINKLTPPVDGWIFIAHSKEEFDFGMSLGYECVKGNYKQLLEVYSHCKEYIGNRVHGGIASRSAGAKAMVVGWESRMFAVSTDNSNMGIYKYPSQLI
jgi:hypothetical protein